ncbi:MAG: GNAT family N-acetyltransferase [Planctomycetia bacterium]|nr:GNAT family N-acetyltransferase [Planctomycetia bacterium]
MELSFKEITSEDIAELSVIMKKAFDYDTSLHTELKTGGPKGYDDGSFLKIWTKKDFVVSYKILSGLNTLGAFFIDVSEISEKSLEMLFLDPKYSSKGVGYKVWQFIEKQFPETKVWKTSTPGYSKRNRNFYINKCGFKISRIENSKNIYDECYYLEKVITGQ